METALSVGLTAVVLNGVEAANNSLLEGTNFTNSSSTFPPDNSPTVLYDLTQTIVVIVLFITLGYLARMTNYMTADAEKGIGQLAGRVSLPCLLANMIATADFSSVSWSVVAIDLVCKSIIIVVAGCVACIAPMGKQPRLSLIGAYGVFVTNSNYMAIGVPLMSQIFAPDKILYLVMFAIMQLMVINPLLFALMLVGQQSAAAIEEGSDDDEEEKSQVAATMRPLGVIKISAIRIGTDPVILAGLVGLVWNFLTTDWVPEILKAFLTTAGNAFALMALFNLGMGVVGHMSSIMSGNLPTCLILILLKSFALPLMEKTVADAFGVDQELTEVLWVAGTIGTAASTAMFVGQFIPDLMPDFRGATIINLIAGMPLLLFTGLLFTSDDEFRGLFTQVGRDWSNIFSILGLIVLLFNFIAVPRWSRYPMWLIFDLAILGLPFYTAHYSCHNFTNNGENHFTLLYTVTNITRLARRAYMLGLSFILLLQIRWEHWFPDVPYGYTNEVHEDDDPESIGSVRLMGGTWMGSDYATVMQRLHWLNRGFTLIYAVAGTVPIMLFAEQMPKSGLSCWCAYGVPQWWYEFVTFVIFSVVQGFLVLRYILGNHHQEDAYPMLYKDTKRGLATILFLQWMSLMTHAVVSGKILFGGAENFQVDATWLQPLLILIIVTDGGGFLLMLVFQSTETAWSAYRQCCYAGWKRIAGPTPSRNLRAYALEMSNDPALVGTRAAQEAPQSMVADGLVEKIDATKKELERLKAEFEKQRDAQMAEETKDEGELRKALGIKYSLPFSGCMATDWMLANGGEAIPSRSEAVKQCEELQAKQLLVACSGQPILPFQDANDYYYRIRIPEFFKFFKRTDDDGNVEVVGGGEFDSDDENMIARPYAHDDEDGGALCCGLIGNEDYEEEEGEEIVVPQAHSTITTTDYTEGTEEGVRSRAKVASAPLLILPSAPRTYEGYNALPQRSYLRSQ